MVTTKLTCRIATPADLPQLLEIWEKYSGWGYISEEDFLKWYVKTPYGESLIAVITDEDSGKVLGQLILVPSQLLIEKQTVKAFRLFAPVIRKEIQGMDIRDYNHPVFSMFRFAMEVARKNGVDILYSFPSVGWLAAFHTLTKYGLPPATTATYNCSAIPFANAGFTDHLSPGRFTISRTKTFTDEFDALWEHAVETLPIRCGIIRTKERLAYRLSSHYVLEGRNEKNELIGYIALRKLNGLIVDALAKSRNDLQFLMHDALRFLHELKQKNETPLGGNTEIKCIRFPLFDNILNTVPHNNILFDFAFANVPISEKFSPRFVEPGEWWMMPDD
jgi:hypothetical protein